MRRIIIIILFSLLSLQGYSQFFHRSEMGVIIGGSNYIGDINPKYNFYNTRPMYGLIYRYSFSPRWVMKFGAMFGSVMADDKDFNNSRNLNFHSKINEYSAVCEFNFFDYKTGSERHRITPYLYGGIAVFTMNPTTTILNPTTHQQELVNLQSLSTEGQGIIGMSDPYSLTQVSLPFGIGVKFSLSEYVCIGIDWGLRYTFTDYIDDVSGSYVDRDILKQWAGDLAVAAADRTHEINGHHNAAGQMRGNPQKNDWYQFFGITITSKLSFLQKKGCFPKW